MHLGNNEGDLDRRLPRIVVPALTAAITGMGVPGVTVAVIWNGVSWSAGIGSADLDGSRPLPADARCYVYSITKVMIAAAIMRLVEQGRIALDQPVGTVLPEPALSPVITLRHLLNHTSGIADYGGMAEYNDALKREPESAWTSDEFLDRVLARGPLFAPGQGWAYSNIGYLLLRRIIERETGASLRVALRKRIEDQLTLRHTFVAESLTDAAGLTPGYSALLREDGRLENVTSRYHPGWVSHGVVSSTAMELAAFLDALFAERIVTADSLGEMLHAVDVPAAHPCFARAAYGLGLMIDPASRYGRVAGHGGGGPGYSIGAFHFSDVHGQPLTSVALVNSDRGDLGVELSFRVAELVAHALA